MKVLERTQHKIVGWRRLAMWTAAGAGVVLLTHGLLRQDHEALVLAVVVAAGIALLWVRDGLLGLLVLGALFADTLFFMFPAANSNASYRVGLLAVAEPAALTALSLAGLVAVVAALLTRRRPEAGERVAAGTGLFVVGFVAAGFAFTWLIAQLPPPEIPPGAVRVETRSLAFSPSSLRAPSGRVEVVMVNQDLFWHTFTIDALDVDTTTPVGAPRSVAFDARPGTYEFYCRVPGHASAGMRGTLTVG